MRRAMAILLAFGLLAAITAVPAEARKKKKKPAIRTFEVRYENPSFAVGGVGGGCSGCPAIPVGPKETFAVIVIEDDVSPSGYIDLAYDSDGDGIQDLGSGPTVCGSTPEPVAVEPGVSYTAWPYLAGIDCPGSSSFAGTIKVMFSNDLKALEKAMKKARP